MAMTNAEATIIAAGTSVAAGGTEASPGTGGTGSVVGPFVDYGDTFSYRITNGASAPGVALTIAFYASNVSSGRWTEIARVSGDVTASSTFSGAIPCPVGFNYFTAKAFSNTTNAVMAEVYLERQVP